MGYRIHFSCVSHIGKIRSMNQDNFICAGRYLELDGNTGQFSMDGTKGIGATCVFGVFDGMGGEERGEVASYIAAKNAAGLTIGRDAISDISRFCRKTNMDICGYTAENNLFAMGTTMAMLVFTSDMIILCNIGDSKIFRLCGGGLEQISKDHVEVSAFGVKPPLSQNLGISPSELVIDPYFAKGDYNDKDVYLICSDGLTDMVAADEIADVLASGEIVEASGRLLAKALANGGRDNISIILCRVERGKVWPFRWKCGILRKGDVKNGT